ncbi:transglutaminase-like domain-containing protein [uncultured Chryseobacterium sp.]|uniref:transglutaminase-like domain-containing protein n=1 Tax=uncultured Chryseobacterium sp. TaxID=259322 RepID=UPI0025D1E567|nr:transglutaminase-like domain-containing protein [uncultured Chryseobacterium sp.]
MKRILWAAMGSLTMTFAQAQKHEFLSPPKFNDADLSKPKSLLDENAPAEVLYRSAHFKMDSRTGYLSKSYFYRVKIYRKDKAEDWLNLEVPLYQGNGGNQETISRMKAFTYNQDNGVKTETKVENNSKYKSKENKNVTVTKFAFPNVKDGSVIEYQYTVESPFAYAIPEFLIETDTPSVYTEYVLDSPVNMSYNVNYTGSLNPKYREIADKNLYGIDYKTYRFAYENLKPFKVEKFVKNDHNYRTKVSAELHSTNFSELKLYSSSWDQIRQRLYDDEDFGGELKKSRFAKDNMPAGVTDMKNELDRANAIFSYVQKTFTWNNKRGIYTEDGLKKMLETKTGNAAEINLYLVMLMREAGIKADPVLISTINNGMINLVSPNVANMNLVIAAIEVNGTIHVYDATTKQSSMDQLPPRDWNQYGVLMAKDNVKQIQMINAKPSFTYLTTNAKINPDGSISGTYTDRDTGTYAMYAKENYDDNQEKYKKQYKENFAIDFTGITSQVLENGDFESSMSFSSENLIDKVGKKIIINPLLFMNKNSNEFDQTDERKYQIDFISPFTKVKKITLEIPEGYAIEEMPKSKKIVTQDKEIEYSYTAEQKGNILEVTSVMTVKSADYPKEYYSAFKQIWGTASKSENQVISLIRKS